jgi:hypothetical protein
MITIFLIGRKLLVLDIFPKGSRFGRLYFLDSTFPDLKKET